MSYVNPTSTASANPAAAPSTGPAAGLNQLDNSQTFLQLLVAQLKNQNPDNPTDPQSFMTEIAQLTAVQSQTSLNAEEQTVAADSMIGRSVSGDSKDGHQVSGTVTGVLLSSSGAPQLQLSGSPTDPTAVTSIAIDAVTRVYQATAPSPASTSTTTTA